jgi:hypothetical protein
MTTTQPTESNWSRTHQHFTRWERRGFWASIALAGLLLWNYIHQPEPATPFIVVELLLVVGIDSLVQRAKERYTKAAPEPQPARSAPPPRSTPLPPRKPLPRVVLTVDLTRTDALGDCCLNCSFKDFCWRTQRKLNENWDYLCESYERKTPAQSGPVVDVGKPPGGK